MEKIKEVSDLTHKYAHEIERLRTEARKREADTKEMIEYLGQEVKRKEHANMKLKAHKDELVKTQESDKQIMKTHFEAVLKRAERVFVEKETQLLGSNAKLGKETKNLDEFKALRQGLAEELASTKQKIDANELWHRQQLDDLERKFLAARDRLEKEASARIAHSRKVYKEEVGRELDEDSKRVRQENRKMEKELQRQEDISNRLQAEQDTMTNTIKRLKLDLDLAMQKGVEYGRRHSRQSSTLEEMQERVSVLEKSLMQVLRELEVEREERDVRHEWEIEEAHRQLDVCKLDADGLTEKVKSLSFHAKTVLRQRVEVEKFFLEEITRCDERAKNRRMLEHKVAKTNHNRAIRALAADDDTSLPSVADHNLADFDQQPEAPFEPMMGLDRAQLLRLLYAKVNNADTVAQKPYPRHSFEVRLDPNGRSKKLGSRPNSRDGGGRRRSGHASQQRSIAYDQAGSQQRQPSSSFFITENQS